MRYTERMEDDVDAVVAALALHLGKFTSPSALRSAAEAAIAAYEAWHDGPEPTQEQKNIAATRLLHQMKARAPR